MHRSLIYPGISPPHSIVSDKLYLVASFLTSFPLFNFVSAELHQRYPFDYSHSFDLTHSINLHLILSTGSLSWIPYTDLVILYTNWTLSQSGQKVLYKSFNAKKETNYRKHLHPKGYAMASFFQPGLQGPVLEDCKGSSGFQVYCNSILPSASRFGNLY